MKTINPYESPAGHKKGRAHYNLLGLLLDVPLLLVSLFVMTALAHNAIKEVGVAVSSATSWRTSMRTYYAGEALFFFQNAITFCVAAVAMVGILSMFAVYMSFRDPRQLSRIYRRFRRCLFLGMILHVALANLSYWLMVWRNHGVNWEYLTLLLVASVMSYPITTTGRGYADMIASGWAKLAILLRLRPPQQTPDNNTLHTKPRAARLLETMMFAAAR